MIENNATYRGFITDNDKMELIKEYQGVEQGAKTQRRWRQDILQDWAKRWAWLK